jgi:ABC-type multidrug transport system ATPase subunit
MLAPNPPLTPTPLPPYADILADRIAVMKTGRLQCVGSSLFLKKRFGVGYNLTVVVDQNTPSVQQDILNFLNHHIANTEIVSVAGKEISFRLPSGSEDNFPALFSEFEGGGFRKQFNIGGYGISNTTLEEVFISLAKEEGGGANAPNSFTSPAVGLPLRPPSEIESLDGSEADSEISLSGVALQGSDGRSDSTPQASPRTSMFKSAYRALQPQSSSAVVDEDSSVSEIEMSAMQELNNLGNDISDGAPQSLTPANHREQFRILMLKRFDVQKRDLKGSFFQIGLPALLVGLVLLILTVEVPLAGPPLELSADLYTWTNSRAFKKQEYTDIMNGGGAHGGTEAAHHSHEMLETELMTFSNGRIDFSFNPELTTSHKVTEKLLAEYNDHSHHLRFGSYVFNDTIPLRLTIDFPSIRYDIDNNIWGGDENSNDLPYDGDLNFVLENLLGKPDSEGYYEYSFNTDQLRYVLEDVLEYDTNLQYNVSDLTEQAEDAVHEILNITNNTDVVTQLEELLVDQAIEEFFKELSNDNETITIDDFLDELVEVAGGNNTVDDIPGWFTVKAQRITVEAATRKIIVEGAVLTVGGGEGGKGEDGTTTTFDSLVFTLPEDWKTILSDSLPNDVYREEFNVSNSHSIIHNATSAHALPSFTQTLFQNLYSQCSESPEGAKFTITNHPLPLTVTQSLEIRTILSLFAALFILIPYCYIPAAFVVFVVKERACKSKHLQLVSGVRISMYWVATYMFDCFLFSILSVLIMITFAWYGSASAEVFVGSLEAFFATLVITLLYGFSSLPFGYILSRGFNNHTTAQISVMGIFFITGFVCVNSYFIMRSIETTAETAAVMVHIFRFFPAYNVGEALINLASSFFQREILSMDVRPFYYHVCGMNMLNMFALSIGYFLILLLLEEAEFGGGGGVVGEKLWEIGKWVERQKLKLYGVREINGRLIADDGLDDASGGSVEDDSDVKSEREFVNGCSDTLKTESAIVIQGLWKVYPPSLGMVSGVRKVLRKLLCGQSSDASKGVKRAVRGVTTSIPKGEIYGLLGVNGAGKTTTLGILTGETAATTGETWVAGFDVGTGPGLKEARKKIGFCPQEDPLLDLMTGRETLRMFAKLRGIHTYKIEATINRLLTAVGLGPHADKVAGAYSGGNKRKLSLGVALIGDPTVLFIDEASSGMDPVARRKMWDLLSKLAKNRSVVLTTHSMEEAEALCSRIMIMVSGRMRCLGSPQHLKTKFVDGFNVDVTCDYDASERDILTVKEYLLGALAGLDVMEEHGRFLKFSWKKTQGGLASAFALLQDAKRGNFKICDYSISQYSLESVFISLAKSGDGAVCAGNVEVLGKWNGGGGGGGGGGEFYVDDSGQLVDVANRTATL